ncbi:MAG: PAS domain S-box protein [Methanomicrobiales archaeon]|nr:PAS domain S-box protein [Methanomicrobiales archaeon]
MTRILYIDDNLAHLTLGKQYLEKTGTFTVETASTTQEAPAGSGFLEYDAIVAGHRLPGLDGIAFLRHIRSLTASIPFILFTGHGSEDLAMAALNEGADFYCEKGAEPATMFAELARAIPFAMARRPAPHAGHTPNMDEARGDRFHELFSNMRSGAAIYTATDDGTDFIIRDFNRAAESIDHLRREDVIGRRVTEVFPAVGKFGLLDVLSRVSKTGTPEHHPVSLYRDGRIHGWRENFVYRLSSGEIVALYDDITEKKKTEDFIRESLERYQLILKNASEGIMVNEMTEEGPGKFIEINESALRILSLARDEIDDLLLIDIDSPEIRARYPDFFDGMNRNGHISFRGNYVTKDGEKKCLAVSASQFMLSGRPAILSVIRDITDENKTELALMHANKKLNLLAGITRHDIKNQLLTLNAYLVLARAPRSDPEKRKDLLKNAEEITKNIERQILFTREYEKLGTSIPAWRNVQESIRQAAGELDLTGIDLLTGDLEAVEIFADNLIQKVFFNLLDNSLRHGGTDMTRIKFSYRETQRGLEILYEDDGVGIPQDEKEVIFERGYGKNTGFGLFFIREILAITAITITENGEPGKGARFVIAVPAGAWRIQTTCP